MDEFKEIRWRQRFEDGHSWLDALSDRNLTVHAYDEEAAKEIVKRIIETYYPQMDNFYKLLKERV